MTVETSENPAIPTSRGNQVSRPRCGTERTYSIMKGVSSLPSRHPPYSLSTFLAPGSNNPSLFLFSVDTYIYLSLLFNASLPFAKPETIAQ